MKSQAEWTIPVSGAPDVERGRSLPSNSAMSAATRATPTGIARPFALEEIIVSKTDLKGHITYANDIFVRVSGYEEHELIGQPHAVIRHPEMPRAVFKLLWDTVESGRELFAYVNNMARNGDHYWVLAHVTPSYDREGRIVGYHSNRRVPEQSALAKVIPLYDALRAAERRHSDRKDGLVASTAMLEGVLAQAGMSYHEWVWTL
jgi:PAS domain S-box-containing protein